MEDNYLEEVTSFDNEKLYRTKNGTFFIIYFYEKLKNEVSILTPEEALSWLYKHDKIKNN